MSKIKLLTHFQENDDSEQFKAGTIIDKELPDDVKKSLVKQGLATNESKELADSSTSDTPSMGKAHAESGSRKSTR